MQYIVLNYIDYNTVEMTSNVPHYIELTQFVVRSNPIAQHT